jgi:hypothetical protein
MPNPSLAVNGRAVCGVLPVVDIVFLDRSSLRGRWRAVGSSGDPGSFLTIIRGGGPACRELCAWKRGNELASRCIRQKQTQKRSSREIKTRLGGDRLLTRWEGMILRLVEAHPWANHYPSVAAVVVQAHWHW